MKRELEKSHERASPATATVPFLDLQAQYRFIKADIDAAVERVLRSCRFVLGPELADFERSFADYMGVKHAVGVSSGTDAIELALRACGIGPGDEVITAVNTYIATCEAISAVGAKVRWVDVDEQTYTLDVRQVETAITTRTKAIIPVHLYGLSANMGSILNIARRHGLKVIEDCAQSPGAKWCGKKTGTFGEAGCFSFFPGKNLGAYGDGGAVVTNDDVVADRVRMLRNHGQREKYIHLVEGGCRRLDNLQAAVLAVKLPHLDRWNESRRRIARRYDELFSDCSGVVAPFCPADAESVYHLYVIQCSERDGLQRALAAKGVETGIHYPIPLHEQPAYAHFGYRAEDFPVASRLSRRILSIPIYPELDGPRVEYVAGSIRAVLAEFCQAGRGLDDKGRQND